MPSIEGTLELRRQQLAAAIEAQSDKVDVYKRTVKSLEDSIGGIRLEAQELSEQGIWIALIGLIILLAVKAAQSAIANSALEARFSEWVSDRSIRLRNTTTTNFLQRDFHDSDRWRSNVPTTVFRDSSNH